MAYFKFIQLQKGYDYNGDPILIKAIGDDYDELKKLFGPFHFSEEEMLEGMDLPKDKRKWAVIFDPEYMKTLEQISNVLYFVDEDDEFGGIQLPHTINFDNLIKIPQIQKTFIVVFSAYDEDDGERFIHSLPCNGKDLDDALDNVKDYYEDMGMTMEQVKENMEYEIKLPVYIEDLTTIIQTDK